MEPEQLGPYLLGEPLGKGGMGTVYRAVHHETSEAVAIKVLSPRLAVANGFRDRFEAEIESLKSLRHAGIVRLLGHGEQDGTLFYAMELVEGASLEDELRNGRRFDWRETTQIALQVCRALKHAHDHGVIHRDIKPANILLSENGRAKLADFGIARVFGSTGGTIAGGVLGTADYMSPEQAAGTPVTARCDQYSLGGVIYALLTGRPPFRAADLVAMLQLQRFAIPEPVSRFAPDTPRELEHIVARMLEKDPAKRFPNTQVIARRIEAMSRALAKVAADDFEVHQTGQAASISEAVTDEPAAANDMALAVTRDATADVPDDSSLSIDLVSEASSPPSKPTSVSSYTAIDGRVESREPTSWGVLLAPVLLVAVAITGLIGAGWWIFRPPTADQLYAKIDGHIERLEASPTAFEAIESFRQRFPEDPRNEEVAEWSELLTQEKIRRRMQLKQRINIRVTSKSTEEILFDRASRLASETPSEAADLLESLAELIRLGDDSPKQVELAAVARNEAIRLAEERRTLAEFCDRKLEAAAELPPEQEATRRAVAKAVMKLLPMSEETRDTLAVAEAMMGE